MARICQRCQHPNEDHAKFCLSCGAMLEVEVADQADPLIGKVIRIENKGRNPTVITEKVVAPSNAVAITIAEPSLAPGAATTAYIVLPAGEAQ